MTFINYILSPKLYKQYKDGPPTKIYEPEGFEKWGDQIFSTLCLMWNISYYTSPIILTFLYRRGYFVVESITSLAKFTTGIGILVALSLCMRGIGRSQSKSYVKFAKVLDNAKTSTTSTAKNELAKKQMREFDFDFKDWPVDWSVEEIENGIEEAKYIKPLNVTRVARKKPFWVSSLPCEVIAYIAIHTFGLRLIYPGSIKFIQGYFQSMLIQGRTKMIEEDNGTRYKIKTKDNNEIDTFCVDNRGKSANGKILVICSEGNAGFYEIGIMSTPLELKYSVLGWNHPGFGGSTGQPYPDQDQFAMDAVIQFAIYKLGFMPENILLFGWSIGGYSSLYAAARYPDVKGVILDATFDDILALALPRMPESFSGIVKIAVRDYVNLNNSELIQQYNGPILMIRRTEDEVISEEMRLDTNRGNYLLISLLKFRFPNIFKAEQIAYVHNLLSKPIDNSDNRTDDGLCLSLLMTYISENSKQYPLEIGADYSIEQKNVMAEYLVRNHFVDFKSSHCTPLPVDYFQSPWDIPNETDFVFT